MQETRTPRYDVAIVGSGFAGATMALLLARAGRRVLVLEAGPGLDALHRDHVERFMLATFKSPSAPYPPDAGALEPSRTNAPRPTIEALLAAWDDPARSYFEHAPGSLPFSSTYERRAGGTGNHWMGTAVRMDGPDFRLRSACGRGLDWPLGYDDLEPYYGQAEHLIGVAGDRDEQEAVNGIPYGAGYAYPMGPIPPSYGDRVVGARLDGTVLADDAPAPARLTSTPAGRNSSPYQNRGPCRGSTSCVPICPVRAKYDPRATLQEALATGRVELLPRAVVDHVQVDEGGRVTGLHYLRYEDDGAPAATGRTGEGVAAADVYGSDESGVNPERRVLAGRPYARAVNDLLTRQTRIAFLVEQEADPSNRVELSDTWTDNLGIPRPRITWGMSDYVRAGFASAREAAARVWARLGATDHTVTREAAPNAFRHDGQTYNYQGGGHLCGTHVMGADPAGSVVNDRQRTWDHPNLYLAGCGSMPSVGTQNPTLTMLAVSCRTVDDILGRLA